MATAAASPAHAASPAARAHASLLPFALCLIAANALVQLVIVLAGHRITVLTTLPLVAIAIGAAIHLVVVGRGLGRVRYGHLVAHALTFVTVTVGYHLHAWVLIASGSPAIRGEGPLLLAAGWMGALFAMPTLWGLGLLIHALAALHQHGFEGPRA